MNNVESTIKCGKGILFVIVINLIVARASVCPCAGDDTVTTIQSSGYCWLFNASDTALTWDDVVSHELTCGPGANSAYRLAVLPDTQIRLVVAQLLAQESSVANDTRLRVSLGRVPGDSQWHWHVAGNTMANVHNRSMLILPSGNGSTIPDGHTTAVLHVLSGQLQAVADSEALPALWQTKCRGAKFVCAPGAAGAMDDVVDEVEVAVGFAQGHCAGHCYESPQCTAFTLQSPTSCALHTGNRVDGGEPSASSRLCRPIGVAALQAACAPVPPVAGDGASVRYDAAAAAATGQYALGTVATIECAQGTRMLNGQTAVETACGEHSEWIGWDAAKQFCTIFSNVWMFHPGYTRWQEWSPWHGARVMPGSTQLPPMAIGGDSHGTYASTYGESVYYMNIATGNVYRIAIGTYELTGATAIPAAHRRIYAGAVTCAVHVTE